MEKEECQPWREGESVQGWDGEENKEGAAMGQRNRSQGD